MRTSAAIAPRIIRPCRLLGFGLVFLLAATHQARGSHSKQEEPQFHPGSLASTYVPLDSWIYPSFDLLASSGLVQSAFFDMRPWTRMTCARLVAEAEDLAADRTVNPQVTRTLRALHHEFAFEVDRSILPARGQLRLESLDQRVTAIAGRPLTDGYHFAETLVNDDGRPFGEGANLYSGIAVRASAGPFAAYIHAEGQRAGMALAPPSQADPAIAIADFTPTAEAGPVSALLRGRLLDANVSFAFANNQLTFGKQTLWWGPARSGATLFSNNAEPITMARYDRTRPIKLPGPFSLLGPISAQLLLGRLSGAQFLHTDSTTFGVPGHALDNQPWIHGQKFTFEPTPNFQFGVSRTVLFAGKGAPFTTRSLLRSLFSTGTGNETRDPGDRRVAFDAQYRIPGLRTCLTGYVDTFTEDEPFPLAYPRRSVWTGGGVLRCFPSTSHLSVRVEGLLSPHRNEFPGYYYFNVHYLSGYTNNRQLIGSWIGREAQGEQAWATWQLSPKSFLELGGRSTHASTEFLHGGTLRDLSATADLALRPEWQLRLEAQSEWWRFPLLADRQQRNGTFTIQLSFRPTAK